MCVWLDARACACHHRRISIIRGQLAGAGAQGGVLVLMLMLVLVLVLVLVLELVLATRRSTLR